MNAYELNKIIGAVLASLVLIMGLSVLSDIIFQEEALEEPAYRIAIATETDTTAEEAPEETSFEVLLASADPSAGESASRVCSACHAFDEGGGNGVGPALWNIVGREIGVVEGFNYSSALANHEAEVWDYAALDGFLENPREWAPGTSMGYAGISDPEQRADVIAYLKSVSPDAPPLPEPPAEAEVAAVDSGDTATDAAAGGEETSGEEAAAAAAEAEAAPAAEGDQAADTSAADPFTQLVASADPAAGEAAAAVCSACHAYEAGAPHKLGPNLHNIFRGPIAGADGFNYSDAMVSYGEEHSEWDIATLDAYLEAPMEVVQGTRMAYAGVKDDEDRAAIIAFLHSISPDAGPIVQASAPSDQETDVAAADATATAAEDGDAASTSEQTAPADAATNEGETDEAAASAETGGEAAPEAESTASPADAGASSGEAEAAAAPSTAEDNQDVAALTPSEGAADAAASEAAAGGESVTAPATEEAAADPAAEQAPTDGSETAANVTIEPASEARIEIVAPAGATQ